MSLGGREHFCFDGLKLYNVFPAQQGCLTIVNKRAQNARGSGDDVARCCRPIIPCGTEKNLSSPDDLSKPHHVFDRHVLRPVRAVVPVTDDEGALSSKLLSGLTEQ